MNWKPIFLYGLLIWVIPFIVGMFAFPLRETQRSLFESIMAVALVVASVLGTYLYSKNDDFKAVPEALMVGAVWVGISLVLDILFFSWGPQKMSVANYLKDIGLSYLIIPIITKASYYFRKA